VNRLEIKDWVFFMTLITPIYFFASVLLIGILKEFVISYFDDGFFTGFLIYSILYLSLTCYFRGIVKTKIGQLKVKNLTGILLWVSSIFLSALFATYLLH
jgi:hypothetical protein